MLTEIVSSVKVKRTYARLCDGKPCVIALTEHVGGSAEQFSVSHGRQTKTFNLTFVEYLLNVKFTPYHENQNLCMYSCVRSTGNQH